MKGGIATYLMQMYRKYFASERFQVIIPNSLGQIADYENMPFEVYRTDFFPFEIETPSRRQTNSMIVDILRQTETDIVLFGYLRSHPEAGRDYKKHKPSARTGIITHAKEAIINGRTGYLINPRSRAALEAKITALYHSPELRIKLGRQARVRANTQFNDIPSTDLITLFS